jgi:hypothetical protein
MCFLLTHPVRSLRQFAARFAQLAHEEQNGTLITEVIERRARIAWDEESRHVGNVFPGAYGGLDGGNFVRCGVPERLGNIAIRRDEIRRMLDAPLAFNIRIC